MKKVNFILRILCGVIDFIILLAPIQFIMIGLFNVSTSQAEFFMKLLMAVYGALFIEYANGKTIGKIFGKIVVTDMSGVKPSLMYAGIRELTKSLYLIPVVGWLLAVVSIFMMLFRKDGRALHDFTGNTKIIYTWQEEEAQKDGT